MEMRILSTAIACLLFFFFTIKETSAQQSPPSTSSSSTCMQRLQPCLDYLDGNRDPPSSCCEPLKYVIKNEAECFCSLISIKGSNQAEKAGINLTNAQQLPARCGERINPLGCILGSSSSSRRASCVTSWIPGLIMAGAVFAI